MLVGPQIAMAHATATLMIAPSRRNRTSWINRRRMGPLYLRPARGTASHSAPPEEERPGREDLACMRQSIRDQPKPNRADRHLLPRAGVIDQPRRRLRHPVIQTRRGGRRAA